MKNKKYFQHISKNVTVLSPSERVRERKLKSEFGGWVR
tara:strand:+ start:2675 stop:2788 length:114 start_codon:yes stop_codon:yes gene_type:complete